MMTEMFHSEHHKHIDDDQYDNALTACNGE